MFAAKKSRRRKRNKQETVRFQFALESNLSALQSELENGTYKPGAFRTHWVFRPKKRLISAAPYRDRVVHHALMNILEPILERHFHPYSFACRKGKGTHAAADTLQQHMRSNPFAMKCDIVKFFPSIDHAILKQKFRKLIADVRVLHLMDMIVDNSNEQEEIVHYFEGDDLFAPLARKRGLPIGNLTSQWFANWYLSGLDHFLAKKIGLPHFVRYCDDFIIAAKTKRELRRSAPAIETFLASIRLKWHVKKLKVSPVTAGVRFAGFRVFVTHRLILKENIRSFRRRLRWLKRAYTCGNINLPELKARLTSWLGHARQAHSERLIRRVSKDWTFVRGGA